MIRFFAVRLKNATPEELLYRARLFWGEKRIRWLIINGRNPVQVPAATDAELRRLQAPVLIGRVENTTIQALLDGFPVPHNSDVTLLEKSEKAVRRQFCGDIRQEKVDIDIRSLWESARLQNLTLALLWLHQKESVPDASCVKKYIRSSLLNWLDNNPFLHGPHYFSAMECGLRISVFYYALTFLDNFSIAERSTIHEAIYQHGWWIERRISLYSSLGNHTLCEALGLVFAGAIYRETTEGRGWLERGSTLLSQQLEHQILPDGGPVEQSLNYHRFVLDLYWLAFDFLQNNGLGECVGFRLRLTKGEEFLAAFRDDGGNVASIGDSDDGHAIAPGMAPQRILPEKNFEPVRTFVDSGYTVIRTGNGALLTFDHGPLGMPPFYCHGHADALAITLSLNGLQMLVDPGTYRYNGEPEFRRYFKGTRAHNTVTIDALDQAVQETGFIWSRPYRAFLCGSRSVGGSAHLLEATHDGYERFRQPVRHTRSVLFFDNKHFLVRDTFSGSGIHLFELNYQLHPAVTIESYGTWWKISQGESSMVIGLIARYLPEICGKLTRHTGWYSPAYGIKNKNTLLRSEQRGRPEDVTFVTAICTDTMVDPRRISELVRLI